MISSHRRFWIIWDCNDPFIRSSFRITSNVCMSCEMVSQDVIRTTMLLFYVYDLSRHSLRNFTSDFSISIKWSISLMKVDNVLVTARIWRKWCAWNFLWVSQVLIYSLESRFGLLRPFQAVMSKTRCCTQREIGHFWLFLEYFCLCYLPHLFSY